MARPLITIGITTYNAADTIAQAISSALAQDWPNFEILIYDDASTDKTVDVLRALAAQHEGIRGLFGKQNRGVAYSRNRLIENAKGAFLAFFDDDDISDPARLSCQYDRITAYEQGFTNGAPVICHTARTQVYPDGAAHYEATMGTEEGKIAPHGQDVAARILTGRKVPESFGSLPTCSQMARLSTYRDLGGFDEAFRRSEDTDFNVRLALKGGHFVGIKDPLVTQTMTLTSDKKLDEELACTLQLLDRHQVFIDRISSHAFCSQWIEAKHEFLSGKRGLFVQKLAALYVRHPVETTKRLVRALPNTGFNVRFSRFHDGQK